MSDLPAQRAAVVGPAVTVEELQAMGVTDKKAAQTIKNLDLCQKVADLKASALKHLAGDMPTAVGKVLFDLASKVKSADDTTLQLVTEFVAKGEISSPEQLNAAISLLNGGDAIDRNALVVECGVGVIVSEETITAVVDRVIAANKEGLDAKGHGFKGTIITQTRGDSGLKWASGAIVTKVIDAKMGALLGEFDPKQMKAQRKKELDDKRKADEKEKKEKKAKEEQSGAAGEAAGDQTVTPWDVQAGEDGVDYDKLIKEFGCEYIYGEQVDRIGKLTGQKPHRFLRRGIFFSQKDLDVVLDCKEKGEDFYLYTGRGPSSASMHLGHLVPFLFTQYLQEAFQVPLVIQMTDDEKFLFKEDLELDYVRQCLRENAKDIIALGFDREKTFMFSDIDYMTGGNGTDFYKNILEVQKRCNLNTAQSIFGFGPEHNIGQISFASIQASPSFASSFPHMISPTARCLIPCAIDQDPYFRMTRAIAPRMKCQKPALIHSKFFPAMTGSSTKMSSSTASPTTIFLTDTADQIADKIKKYAFSGAPKTLAEHKEKGADLAVDVSYQYLRFFLEDDEELDSIGKAYSSGKMMTGEVKAELTKVLQELVAAFQVRRAAVTDAEVDYFMSVEKFKKHKESASNSTADAGVASLQQYLSTHNIEGLLGNAANHIAGDKPADPIKALAEYFAKMSSK